MPVLKHELKWHMRFLRGWLIAVVLTVALFMSFFNAFNEGMDQVVKMLEGFPEEVMRGFGLEISSFGTYSGFLAYIYTFVQFLLVIIAVMSGMMLMGREKISKTGDFLFSKPVSRSSLWVQKNTVGFLGILLINAVVAAIIYGLAVVQDVEMEIAVRDILFSSVLVQLIFFLFGGMLATMRKRLRTVTGTASSIGIGFYFLLIIGRLLEEDKLSKISIYGLFDTAQVQKNGIETVNLVIGCVLATAFAFIGYQLYTKMDLEV
ncbi:MAG TPA: ABC transporter permease subunit [Mogibacterium sp.]|nr:ABC transporter permease subunit [Mogibacterium sp.]